MGATRGTRLWHAFAEMGAVCRDGEFVLERGDDVWVFDQDGRRYLDATASLWYANVGHGPNGFGTSLAGIAANRAGWGPLIADTALVAYDSPQALRDELERRGPETVAAFFLEPVIGAGGVFPPPPGYIEAVASICRDA